MQEGSIAEKPGSKAVKIYKRGDSLSMPPALECTRLELQGTLHFLYHPFHRGPSYRVLHKEKGKAAHFGAISQASVF